jgi:hypothetical protein
MLAQSDGDVHFLREIGGTEFAIGPALVNATLAEYAARGWSLKPVLAGQKRPAITRKLLASTRRTPKSTAEVTCIRSLITELISGQN